MEDRKKDGGIRTKLELEKRGEKTGIEPEAAAGRTATPSSARECAPKEGLEAKSELSHAKITNGSGDFLKKPLHESSEVKCALQLISSRVGAHNQNVAPAA